MVPCEYLPLSAGTTSPSVVNALYGRYDNEYCDANTIWRRVASSMQGRGKTSGDSSPQQVV